MALTDRGVERRVRIHIPRSFSAFADVAAVQILSQIMISDQEGLIRYKALRGLGQLARETSLIIPVQPIADELKRNAIEYLRLFSARTAIERDTADRSAVGREARDRVARRQDQQSFDRIARLLQIVHRADDIRAIFSALSSPDRRQRGQAIEFLDALIRGVGRSADDVVALLRLVVDDLPAVERARRSTELVGSFGSAHDTLDQLASDADAILSDLAVHAVQALDRPRVTESASLLQLLERPA